MAFADEVTIARNTVPKLYSQLESNSILYYERCDHNVLEKMFREYGEPGLLIPKELGGSGLPANQISQLISYVGSRCPSLAIMMTMHHHTVAGMVAGRTFFPQINELLSSIAKNNLLVASAFSEGRAHSPNLHSQMKIEKINGGYLLNGSKKPCSLTHSFDVITVGINYVEQNGFTRIGIGMAFRDNPSLHRKSFWNSPYLSASDSNEVIFDNLFIPDELMCFSDEADRNLTEVNKGAGIHMFAIWFQLLAAASYLGMAKALANLAISKKKGAEEDRASLLIDIQGANFILAGLSNSISNFDYSTRGLANALAARFSIQNIVHRISTNAFETLGGISFLSSEEPSYLLVATRLLAFHPSSKLSSNNFICEQLS